MPDLSTIIPHLLEASNVHTDWKQPLTNALQAMDVDYLINLSTDDSWLPGKQNLFAAFRNDPANCRYILFGESPYPRAASANGIAFYDAAVNELWSDKGLSKPINRATSLRNMMKAMLLAQNLITPDNEGKITQGMIASVDKQPLIQTIHQLFGRLQQKGFVLMNATPVLHPDRKPQQEARYWIEFIGLLLKEISKLENHNPTLLLWGKIAQQIEQHEVTQQFPQLVCEHPYNISFITQPDIQQLFHSLNLLENQ